MANAPAEADIIARLARDHGLSTGAVAAVLQALRHGGGTMAQFSHAEFGGMSQWSAGMTMVGDMFNDSLKAKLSAVAGERSVYVRNQPAEQPAGLAETSYRSGVASGADAWWPAMLGQPSAVGSQNDMRYAVFPAAHRLAIDDHGSMMIYDSGDHDITGVSQSQSSESTLTFASQLGLVRVSELTRVDPA